MQYSQPRELQLVSYSGNASQSVVLVLALVLALVVALAVVLAWVLFPEGSGTIFETGGTLASRRPLFISYLSKRLILDFRCCPCAKLCARFFWPEAGKLACQCDAIMKGLLDIYLTRRVIGHGGEAIYLVRCTSPRFE